MNGNMIIIAFSIVVITIVIYFIKNFEDFLIILEKIKNKKYFNIITRILFILVIICLAFFIYEKINTVYNSICFYTTTQENNAMFETADEKISEEKEFYENAISLSYENQNPKEPYIPEGFHYIEGEWNTGFVIQDDNGNEYVWIPCTNTINDEVVKLERKNFSEFCTDILISTDSCYNIEYKEFIKSALENGGFYISRYEIGKENDTAVSKPGVEVYGNITKNEALDLISNMYENINCKLINGYAYDTALSFIEKNNNITFYKTDVRENNNIIYSGRNSYNNIFDLTDNILEFSQEVHYDTDVVRGFSFEKEIEGRTRYTIFEDDTFFDFASLITFRTVIYK
jgi:hypothetical protein